MTDTWDTYPHAACAGLIKAMMRKLPHRVQLRRAKGWRMPDNTVKVDRTTKWGNPFVVGKDGTAAECVDLYAKMLAGYLALACTPELIEQVAARDYVIRNIALIKGKNLACWCRQGAACHADVLLDIANRAAP